MIRFTQSPWTITFTGRRIGSDCYIYSDERACLILEHTPIGSNDENLISCQINGVRVGGWYTTSDLYLEVDFTYLLRNLPIGQTFTIDLWTENAQTLSFSQTFYYVGGVDLKREVCPLPSELIQALPTTSGAYINGYICAPNSILGVPGGYQYPYIQLEMTDWSWVPNVGGSWTTPESYSNNGNQSTVLFRGDTKAIRFSDKNDSYIINLEETGPCDELVLVCWKSRTGNWRQVLFSTKNQSTKIDSTNQTDPLGNDYSTVKTYSQSVDLEIKGLTRHSLWWYQDILTSNEIYMLPYTYNMIHEDGLTYLYEYGQINRCDITNNKVTQKNGNSKLFDFTLTMKYRQFPI